MFVTLQNSISVQNTDMSFQIKIRKLRLNPHNPKSFWKIKYSTAIVFKLFEEPKTLRLALLPSTLFKIDKSATFNILSTGTLCLLPISILGASAGTIRAVPDTVKKVPGLAPVLFHCSKKIEMVKSRKLSLTFKWNIVFYHKYQIMKSVTIDFR